MTVTQSELAKQLGISQRSVSVAFGGAGRISERTRQSVLRAADRLGYRPNHLASGLRGGKTRSVGVIWAFANPWAGDSIIALELLRRLQGQGFAIYQSQSSEDTQVVCRQLDDLLARRADALVIQTIPSLLRHPAVVERLLSFTTAVAVCREDVPELACDLLVHDRDQAIREVVDHLAATGRRRLSMAMAIGQESNPPKFEVFVQQCRLHGLPDHPDMLIDLPRTDDPTHQGQMHAEAMRRQFPPGKARELPDAIFCFNDTGALFVLSELQSRGVRVPEDVAVVGFNDMEVGKAWRPPLASGDRMHLQVADAVERMLLARTQDPGLPPQRETVYMKFIWRESAGGTPPTV